MRLSLRFILPLVIVLGLVAYAVAPLVNSLTFKWFTRDIDIRIKLITNTLQDSLILLLEKPSDGKIQRLFTRVIQDERLYALAFCDSEKHLLYKTQTFPAIIACDQKTWMVTQLVELLRWSRAHSMLLFLLLKKMEKSLGISFWCTI